MKVLLSILLLFPSILCAQQKLQVSDSRTVFMEKVISAPQYSKHQLFEKALSWASEIFTSPKDAITFNDSIIGKINLSMIADYKTGLSYMTCEQNVSIYVKNHKLKIKIGDIRELKYQIPLRKYILKRDNSFRKYSGLTSDVNRTLNSLINSLEDYIKNYKSKNDW